MLHEPHKKSFLIAAILFKISTWIFFFWNYSNNSLAFHLWIKDNFIKGERISFIIFWQIWIIGCPPTPTACGRTFAFFSWGGLFLFWRENYVFSWQKFLLMWNISFLDIKYFTSWKRFFLRWIYFFSGDGNILFLKGVSLDVEIIFSFKVEIFLFLR